MNKINTQALKPYSVQLILVAIATIVSIAILGAGYYYYTDAKQKNTQAIALQDSIYRDIDQLIENKRFLDNAGDSFTRIQAQGFFGDEDRLAWAETLKTTAQNLKLPNLKYSIRPQQAVSNIGPGVSPALHLSESIMDIEADLLHEGDFIEISKQLTKMPGLFRVQGCELNKAKEISLTEPAKNIALKCSLAWHTVKHSPIDDADIDGEFDPDLL